MDEKTRVLVVDDDRRMVKTTCDILAVKGYDVVEAFAGEEAVEKAGSERPDCVLMDIKMPGMDGIEALKSIRRISPGLPVVLMSAYVTEEQASEAKKQGACGVLTKPVDVEMVLSFLSLLRKEESIFIVDDDPLFCRTLRGVLRTRGYRVDTEIDPRKVLGHMESNYKLVVLLDLKLGDTSGIDVLGEIRARYPSKPVVLVTGYGEEMTAAIQKGLKIGAYTCLYKPFEAEVLFDLIGEISRKKQQAALGGSFEPACAKGDMRK